MTQHRIGWIRKLRAVFWRRLRAGLITLLAGCQAVPARVTTCCHPATHLPRGVLVAGQVAVDTAVETAQRPLRSLSTIVIEPAMAAREAASGLLRKRLALSLSPRPGPLVPCRPTLDIDDLEKELRRVAKDKLQPAEIQLITDGREALAALEDAVGQATCQIDVLMYLWDNDPLGWQVARLLAARASPTVRVRVLVDGGGNLLQGEPGRAGAGHANAVVCWLARQPYVQVIRTRNPFCRFDHRKLVLIDGRLVWSGGRNFTWGAFFEAHDLTYLLTGPLTAEIAARYENFWRGQGGPPGPPPPPPLPAPQANTLARLVQTRPYECNLANTVYTAVARARNHIYIENPFFVDNQLFLKLVQARRQGVDVRVMLTLDTGVKLIDVANRVTVNRLLRAGIRVYLYPGQTHIKAMSVDGCWAYLGTGNFDRLSLRHNREMGLAISHGPLVAELEERIFLTDFRPEWEVCQPLPLVGYEYMAETLASIFL